jgi:hypothetical protein
MDPIYMTSLILKQTSSWVYLAKEYISLLKVGFCGVRMPSLFKIQYQGPSGQFRGASCQFMSASIQYQGASSQFKSASRQYQGASIAS